MQSKPNGKGKCDKTFSELEDFRFRFSLAEEDIQLLPPIYEDKVNEFFRQQIINLLDVVELKCAGKPLKIDGFSFISKPHKIYKLF